MIKSGLARLDKILGGGFAEGFNIAFIGTFENDHILLMHQVLRSMLEQGKKILLLEFRDYPKTMTEWLEFYGISYNKYILREQLVILDGYTNMYSTRRVTENNVLSNPLDIPIVTSIIKDKVKKEGFDYVVFDDFTTLYALLPNRSVYLRAMIRFTNSMRSLGAGVIGALEKDVMPLADFAVMMMPFGYIISVDSSNRSITVLKSPYSFSGIRMSFIYIKTPRGIEVYMESEEAMNLLEQIRSSLRMDEKGRLWIMDNRSQIVTNSSEASLIETIYEYLGEEKGRKLLYLWGRRESEGYGKFMIETHGPDKLEEVLQDVSKSTALSGGGLLKIVQIGDDLVLLRGKHLFPEKKSKFPMHVHYAGGLAQILTEYTDHKWEGDEVKCESVGDPYCEIVVRKVE